MNTTLANLEAFLAGPIEKYVLGDLEAMNEKQLGYPVLMTAFSGIELLGALLSDVPFNTKNGDKYFEEYWNKHLYPNQDEKVAKAIYQLFRNGIAHLFLLKGSLIVDTIDNQRHLKRAPNGTIYIYSRQLTDDFKTSFRRLKNQQAFLDNAQQRLNEISCTYLKQFESQKREFESLTLIADDEALPCDGASGPNGSY